MKKLRARLLLVVALCATSMSTIAGPSVYATAPPDPRAFTVSAVGDGRSDDSAAIQKTLDAAAGGAGGIVYLPSGRYRITRTLFIWPGIRVFGVGATRPVLLLADNTPGFDQGVANMVIFAGRGPAADGRPAARVPFPPPGSVPFNAGIADANPGTFYSAMANVDIEIGKGNPAAAAIRFHAAQHAYLRHMDFRLGSAFAGVYMVGNEAEDLHFHGGRYGIVTEKPSPAWPFALVDCSFEGQRDAAIREHEAGLTLLNVSFRDVPVGIEIDEGYGDWLFGKDLRFENVSQAAVLISNEDNAYTQVSFENVLAARTPVFARFRDSGRTVAQKGSYRVGEFTYGLTLPAPGAMGTYETRFNAEPLARLPERAPPTLRALPPVKDWVDVRKLGVMGDGKTDDTAALRAAIANHRVLYFPAGFYVASDTLLLKPDTVLIALHPSLTQVTLPDGAPAFQGVGAPRALIEAPRGGDNIISGLGLFTGGINPRATALLWKAGASSLVDDVKLQGGHGTFLADGRSFNPYDPYHAGDPDQRRRWEGQYPSIMVLDGGGGTFINIWSPNTYAQSAFQVSDTKTPGRIIQISAEHHVRAEIGLNRVENWELFAPQTEEEVGEGQDTVALEIRNSRHILVANFHGYRVTRSVKPVHAAVRLENVADIRFRNVHVNAESGLGTCDAIGCGTTLRASKYPYENAIFDVTHRLEVREREFAVLDIPASPAQQPRQGPAVSKLADGFWSIAGAAAAPGGKLYFIDRKFQRIHGWSESEGLTTERDNTLDPVNLAVDRAGNLLVLSSDGAAGTVYAFKPGSSEQELTLIAPVETAARTNARTLLPVNYWNNGEFKDQYDPASDRFTTLAQMFARDLALPKAREYLSPDGSLVLPAYRVFQQGQPNSLGWRWSDALQAHGFTTAAPGERVFFTNESENRTYSGVLAAGGAISDLQAFANRGGESVARAPDGRVFVANGQVFIYAPDGRELGRIDVPERPLQILFGGADGRTLYILAHHALYSARP